MNHQMETQLKHDSNDKALLKTPKHISKNNYSFEERNALPKEQNYHPYLRRMVVATKKYTHQISQG